MTQADARSVGVNAPGLEVRVAAHGALAPATTRVERRSEKRSAWFELLTIDAMTAGAVLCGSSAIRLRPSIDHPHVLLLAALFVVPAWTAVLLGCALTGTYRRARLRLDRPAPLELPSLVLAVGLAAVSCLGVGSLLPRRYAVLYHPPADVLVTLLCCALALPIARAAALAYDRRRGIVMARTVIVGTGLIAGDVAKRLARSGRTEVLGYVDDDPESLSDYLGRVDDLAAVCARFDIDRVVVAFSRSHPASMASALRGLPRDVTVDVVPRYYELTGLQASLGDLSGMPIICLGERRHNALSIATKRAIDIAASAMGLFLLSPVVLLTALAVRMSSPGPILYRQTRLGRDRVPFQIFKFRTMHDLAELKLLDNGADRLRTPLSEQKHTARVTSVGRLLRRSGVDELPQLLNVLRGEMSLVGPRPFVPEECQGLESWVERRFEMRPGITGLWQVCGQHHLRLDELWQLDSQYVTTWSLGTDLKVLARTPSRLIRGDRTVGG